MCCISWKDVVIYKRLKLGVSFLACGRLHWASFCISDVHELAVPPKKDFSSKLLRWFQSKNCSSLDVVRLSNISQKKQRLERRLKNVYKFVSQKILLLLPLIISHSLRVALCLFKAQTHQSDIKELVMKTANSYVASCCLCVSQKVALEDIAQTTASV